jgi:NSS family neurotransmitter:Na+ symporter
MNTVWNNFALPLGGFLVALFVGHVWGADRAIEELVAERAWFPHPKLWATLVGFVAPAAIVVVIVGAVVALI